MDIVTLTLKRYPNAQVIRVGSRLALKHNDRYIIPKRLYNGIIRLYKYDLLLPPNKTTFVCFDRKDRFLGEVELTQQLIDLVKKSPVVYKGFRFVYLDRVREKGKYVGLSIILPIQLKQKMDRLISSGKYSNYSEIIKKALFNFLQVKE